MTARTTPIRILVVDDHELFRAGLVRLLGHEDDLEVVGQAASCAQAVARAAALAPDVVLMDLNLPDGSGLEATTEVLRTAPEVAVVVLTVAEEDDAVLGAVLAGASGYLLKGSPLPEIVAAVRGVVCGHAPIAASVTPGLLSVLRTQRPLAPTASAPADAPAALSEREHDVLRLLIEGHDNLVIGERLFLSTSTVKHHVSSILRKLEVDNRIQAAVLAVRGGLVA
jgi:DNA-binding NarL/FixJ family response regulator